MAQRRMFSLRVVDTDKFMDMPTSTQALYFHLGMHGDDDGFVSSPKKIARAAGCNDDDLRLLASKGFIIPFESGVVVISEWRVNNTLKNDRYQPTLYQEEMATLQNDGSGKYIVSSNVVPLRFQNGSTAEPQHNLTKPNPTEPNPTEGRTAAKPPRTRFSPPTVEDVRAYCQEKGYAVDPQRFVDYYTSNGWRVGKNPMRDWKAAVRNWNSKENGKECTNGKDDLPPTWSVGTTV